MRAPVTGVPTVMRGNEAGRPMAIDTVRSESFAVGERSPFESVFFSAPVVSPKTTAVHCVGPPATRPRTQENLARRGRLTLKWGTLCICESCDRAVILSRSLEANLAAE